MQDDLRINYSKLWLSLIAPPSKQIMEERKKYAKLVGNIDEDLYPVFEAAITGNSLVPVGKVRRSRELKVAPRSMTRLKRSTSTTARALQTTTI